jgi:hypothetical protein
MPRAKGKQPPVQTVQIIDAVRLLTLAVRCDFEAADTREAIVLEGYGRACRMLEEYKTWALARIKETS